ncbi:MAG TPA: PQQ-binding-like beta-propeller repeat protein [Vicinamibacteria bacterium]|nr:PQQ-binding-like beta-propeller repeat protein [Vicinamibacteria bacterium]
MSDPPEGTRLGGFVAVKAFPGHLVLALAVAAGAEDWPQWRGPRADGTSMATGVPTTWGRDTGLCWSVDLPGEGHSSPVVSGTSVFVTTALGGGHERALLRLHAATGELLWARTVARSRDLESLHSENSHVSSTPATDGRAVYTSNYESGRAHIAAVDYEGRVLWSATPVAYRAMHGYHHNPLLLDGQLVLSFDQLAEAAVIALDAGTGRPRWRVPLPNDECSNVAPFPAPAEGRTLVVTVGNDVTRAIDPRDGRVVWRAAGPTRYCVAGVAYGSGLLFVNGGYPDRRSLAFRLDGATGQVPAWESRRGTTYVPSPVYRGGHFYAVNDGGLATAWDAGTGAVKWQQRLGGRHRASLVLAQGLLYATDDAGVTTVFQANPARYQEVARNDLGELVYATPAVSDGRIFIRTRSRLHAVGECAAPGTAGRSAAVRPGSSSRPPPARR